MLKKLAEIKKIRGRPEELIYARNTGKDPPRSLAYMPSNLEATHQNTWANLQTRIFD
jgi:hypothetical protein